MPDPGLVRKSGTEAAADPGRGEVEVHVQDPRSPTPETAEAIAAVEPESEKRAPDRATTEPEDSLDDEPLRRDLSGRVLDETGTPVSGLQVLATARRLVPLGQEVAVVAGDRQRSTRTNVDGHFTFQGLLDGEYQVHTEGNDQYGEATALVRAGVDSAVLVVTEKTNRSVHLHGLVESVREATRPYAPLESDNATLLVAKVVRKYAADVPIIAAVRALENVERILAAGADFALSIGQVAGQLLSHHVLGETVSLQPRIQLAKFAPGALAGRHPLAVGIRERTGCSVVAVERQGEILIDFPSDFELSGDDALYLCGTGNAFSRYRKAFPTGVLQT